MSTGIIIQARMGSNRLPGKVLEPLAGREVLWHVVRRCQRSREADKLIVATSDDAVDDVVFELCRRHDFACYRGSEADVLERYYLCAGRYELDVIVRVTADSPLIDPEIIDQSVRAFRRRRVDYLSNRRLPPGLGCEVFTFDALARAHEQASRPPERDHVTPYMIEHAHTSAYVVPHEYQADHRLTLDFEEDYRLLAELYDRFYPADGSGMVDVRQVIRYLDLHPEVAALNAGVERPADGTDEPSR